MFARTRGFRAPSANSDLFGLLQNEEWGRKKCVNKSPLSLWEKMSESLNGSSGTRASRKALRCTQRYESSQCTGAQDDARFHHLFTFWFSFRFLSFHSIHRAIRSGRSFTPTHNACPCVCSLRYDFQRQRTHCNGRVCAFDISNCLKQWEMEKNEKLTQTSQFLRVGETLNHEHSPILFRLGLCRAQTFPIDFYRSKSTVMESDCHCDRLDSLREVRSRKSNTTIDKLHRAKSVGATRTRTRSYVQRAEVELRRCYSEATRF